MSKRVVIKSGDKFGYLTVIREVEPNITPCGTVQRKFLCQCDCGNQVVRNLSGLRRSDKANCGCKNYNIGELNKKYLKEYTQSFLYSTWHGMRQRCLDKNSSHYKYYGAKGITICDDWLNDYTKFYEWAIKNGASKDCTIDRIDVNGNYEPSNCRWVDAITQANNKTQNRIIEYNEEKLTLAQWSKKVGIKESTIRRRIDRYGYTIDEALGFRPHKFKEYDRSNSRKKVEQYSLSGEFLRLWDSAQEASTTLNVSIQGIRLCATGIYKKSHGYIWKYKSK